MSGGESALPNGAAKSEDAERQAIKSSSGSFWSGERGGEHEDGDGLAVYDGQAFVLNMVGAFTLIAPCAMLGIIQCDRPTLP